MVNRHNERRILSQAEIDELARMDKKSLCKKHGESEHEDRLTPRIVGETDIAYVHILYNNENGICVSTTQPLIYIDDKTGDDGQGA